MAAEAPAPLSMPSGMSASEFGTPSVAMIRVSNARSATARSSLSARGFSSATCATKSGAPTMSQNATGSEGEAQDYLICKRGYWYRPNRSGYTSLDYEAGRYTRSEAEREAAIEPWQIRAVPIASLPESSVLTLTTRAERAEAGQAKAIDERDWAAKEALAYLEERDASHADNARLRAENAGLREGNERIGRELITRYDDTDRLQEKIARLATDLDQMRPINETLRKTLEPFAEVYRWAAENEDPSKIDFVIRHFDRGNLGHLQVQMDDFQRARAALSSEPQAAAEGER